MRRVAKLRAGNFLMVLLASGALLCALFGGCSLIFPFEPSGTEPQHDAALVEGGTNEVGVGEGSPGPDVAADEAGTIDGPHEDGKPVDLLASDFKPTCILASCAGWWCPMDKSSTMDANIKLLGVWGASDLTSLWAVGENATLLRFNTSSCEWEPWALEQDLGTSTYTSLVKGKTLSAVWGSGPTEVYVVGETEILLHFNGTKWNVETLSAGAGSNKNKIWALGGGSGDVLAAGEGGLILRRESGMWKDHSFNTTQTLTGLTDQSPVASAASVGSTAIYAVGTGGELLYNDGSVKGEFKDLTTLHTSCSTSTHWMAAYAPKNPGSTDAALLVVGDKAATLAFFPPTKGCVLFTVGTLGSKVLRAVDGRAPKTEVWAVGDGGAVAYYLGTLWKQVTQTATTETLRGVWATRKGTNHVIAVGDNGTIIYSDR